MIIFVGDKPSPKMKKGAKAFQGAACEERLGKWIDAMELNSETSDHNIHTMNQSDFETEDLKNYCKGCIIITLGNNASKALKDIPHFKLPPPSGRNRQINNKKFIVERLKSCKEWTGVRRW